VLIEASGDFISREELIRRVWGEGADGGVLNVYVHYLREKLEKQGEKIIISSRKNGYKIDGKYLTKGEDYDA
jgi:DNA-binding response OmpR family regulator